MFSKTVSLASVRRCHKNEQFLLIFERLCARLISAEFVCLKSNFLKGRYDRRDSSGLVRFLFISRHDSSFESLEISNKAGPDVWY